VNGVDRTGAFTIPDTGGWQRWITIRRTGLSLNAGQQVWRVVARTGGSNGAVGNINFIRVQSAGGTAPPPAGGNGDIVLYASDVTSVAGNWVRTGASGAAGGETMRSADHGWSAANRALASPANYFEARFVPEANRAYRLWLRLRAGGDSRYNESVWVQFGGAVDAGGGPLWRVGTTSALLVNLEPCGGCGVSGWGWQNSAWWLADDPIVRFPTATTQTIRVQTREDGVEIDQIVLSPSTYMTAAPGRARDDTTIVPKPGTGTSNQAPTAGITSPANGASYTAPATMTINATASDSDGSVIRVEFYRGSTLIGSDTSAPYSVTWSDVAAGTYALTAVAFDDDGASTASAVVNVTVNAVQAPTATQVAFTASPDHATGVTSYLVAIFRSGDPLSGTPAASTNVGKPAPSNNEIVVDVSAIVNPLPAGSYYAAVTAIGPGGSGVSAPSAAFTK
jgi:hypothetical protein